MRRGGVLVIGGGAIVAGALLMSPLAARRLTFFKVRQVEILGVRYLTPDAVLDALRLSSDQSVFDDTDPLGERAQRIGGVIAARVERRLPATLRVHITEQVPMAFAPGPQGFVALDGQGRPLPYDPVGGGLDLPVVAHADTLLVRTLAAVRFANPDLYDAVEWVDYAPKGGIELVVAGQRVIVAAMPTVLEVDAVRAVQRHLSQRGRAYRELDARLGGWVVVRGSS